MKHLLVLANCCILAASARTTDSRPKLLSRSNGQGQILHKRGRSSNKQENPNPSVQQGSKQGKPAQGNTPSKQYAQFRQQQRQQPYPSSQRPSRITKPGNFLPSNQPTSTFEPPYSRPHDAPPLYNAVARISVRGPGSVQQSRGNVRSIESTLPNTDTHRTATDAAIASAGGSSWLPPPADGQLQHADRHPVRAEAWGGVASAHIITPLGGSAYVKSNLPNGQTQHDVVLSGQTRSFVAGPSYPQPARIQATGTEGTYIHVTGQHPPI